MIWSQLPFIYKVKTNQRAFGEKVIKIADSLGFSPAWIMVVMNNESGLDEDARNPYGSAIGLIQFLENTARGLGTSTAALLAMNNVEQLDYVEKYFETYASKIKSLPDTYLAVFYPSAIGKPGNWFFPDNIVSVNKIFDINKDGRLRRDEFDRYVNTKYAAYIASDGDVYNVIKRKVFNKRTTPVFVVGAVLVAVGIGIYIHYK